MNGRLAFLSLMAALALQADPSVATFASFNDWIGAEARGVQVGADGRLKLAPHLRRVAQLPEGVVWAAVPDGSGGLFLSAGTEGKLFHFTNGQVKPLAQVKGGIVFAMVRHGQDLIVAPSGEQKLLRVTPSGDVKAFAEIDARVVWAMAVQGSELYVAGGNERGAVLILARDGSSRKLSELGEAPAFTSMIPDGQGGWYLGALGRGLVLRYGGDRLETLAATGFEEVRALAVANGDLYIGASNGLSSHFSSGQLEKREGYLAEPSTQTKGAVIRIGRDRVPELLWQSRQSQVFALASWNGQLLVGTGNRSRIFSIPLEGKNRDLSPFSALQDLGTAQATAFLRMGSDLMVVGSNPAELHLLSEAQATEGTLDSRILKASPIADWGRAYVDAETLPGTAVELQFRVGSTEHPDGTWSSWTPPLKSGERPNLSPSRFAQFRLRMSSTRGGSTPVVDGVQAYWANRNLPPVWEGVEILPPGLVVVRSGPGEDIGVERVPLETQKLIPALSFASQEKRGFRRGSQAFLFKASDPNGDPLDFKIRLLPEKGAPLELEKAWRERFFTMDTLAVPDGRYRLEVTASDAPARPFNQVLSSTWRTAVFTVDHTPPVIAELTAIREGEGLRVKFLAKDETSILKEAALSSDGETWLPLAPEDGIFDMREERFDVLIPRDRVRGDRLMVKVSDGRGNEQTAFVPIADPKKR